MENRKVIISFLVLGFVLLMSCDKETSCDKEPPDYRSVYTGNWEFQTATTSFDPTGQKPFHEDTFYYDGSIEIGHDIDEIDIFYTEFWSATLRVNEFGELRNCDDGKFIGTDSVHFVLLYDGEASRVVDGKKK